MSALAEVLSMDPHAVTTLLKAHQDDGTGHCRSCPIGGQRGYQTWPCSSFCAARVARELIRARRA